MVGNMSINFCMPLTGDTVINLSVAHTFENENEFLKGEEEQGHSPFGRIIYMNFLEIRK